MPKPEWGSKHRCEKCETRFYDLMRNPVECPHCGEPVYQYARVGLSDGRSMTSGAGAGIAPVIESDPILKASEDVSIDADEDDVLDTDDDTVSLDDIKNVSTEDTE